MELQFLGTGAGMPSKTRNTSSLLVNLTAEGRGYWLFDCGEATQHQILHTSLKPRKIERIFITHLHGDHIFGLPGLLSSRSFLGGHEPLDIYGPPGLEDWLLSTLKMTNTHLGYTLRVHEITEEGSLIDEADFKVSVQKLQHVIQCFGFRIEQKPLPGKLLIEKAITLGVPKGPFLKALKEGNDVTLADGRVILSEQVTGEPQPGFTLAILGDTSYCETAIELAKEADILVHEATFDNETGALAKEYGHSTIEYAATVAKKSGTHTLIANHISARFLPSHLEQLKKQGQVIFHNIHIAEDFVCYEWKNGELIESRNHVRS